jgi:hypothetical protein
MPLAATALIGWLLAGLTRQELLATLIPFANRRIGRCRVESNGPRIF